MGLLDNILKNVDSKALNESLGTLAGELKKVAEAVSESIPEDVKNSIKEEMAKEKASSEAKQTDPQALAQAQARTDVSYATASYEGINKEDYANSLPEDELDCKAKLMEVLEADFPQYTVYEDFSPTMLGGTGKFMNYSLALYKENSPALFIMIVGKATTRHREYRWSKEQAAKCGVPMINFIGHAPNRYWYIKDRLSKYL